MPIFPTLLVIAVQTLSDSTENFLKILIIFLDPNNSWKLLETVWGFREPFETFENYLTLQEFFETSENFLKLPRNVWKFEELFKTSKNCFKIWRIVWNFQKLFEKSKNCLRLLRTVWNFQERLEISTNSISDFREVSDISESCLRIPKENYWRYLRTLEKEKKWWKRIVALQIHRIYTILLYFFYSFELIVNFFWYKTIIFKVY